MKITEVGMHRLFNQHVGEKRLTTVKELVEWMGAMQAQDMASAKWGIGVRIPGINEKIVDEAINNGEIIRTHVMRPTWHLVAAKDYHSMMRLTAPSINVSLKTRQKQLELDEDFFKVSNEAVEKILANGNHLTREELTRELSINISNLDSSRMNHILLKAELDRLICSGIIKKRRQTYALVSERIKIKDDFDKDQSMMMLAEKYFASHGPATMLDFNWWSGLPISDCKKAVELIKNKLQSIQIDKQTYWFKELNSSTTSYKKKLFLLPAFDEFLISYRDRSAVLTVYDQQKAVSSNGIFRPVIVLGGKVIGLWNKNIKNGASNIIVELSIAEDQSVRSLIDKAAQGYYKFIR